MGLRRGRALLLLECVRLGSLRYDLPMSHPRAKPATPCRVLKLATLDDLLCELDAIESADRAGTLRTCGNWSAGKILGHLSSWIDYAYDGFPSLPPAWVIPLFRLMKPVLMKDRPLRPGMRIPGTTEGTHGVDEMTTQEGLVRLRASIERLRARIPDSHPLFGVLARQEWERMHLNHAVLHLGFISPNGDTH